MRRVSTHPISMDVAVRALAVLITVLPVAGCGNSDETAEQAAVEPVAFDEQERVRISVSGVSSGAYMAVQTQVALADRIAGVAALAGGPYHCAEGSVQTALGPCIKGEGLNVEPMLATVNERAAAGTIAGTEQLAGSRAWVFHSPTDGIVSPRTSEVLVEFYRNFLPAESIVFVNDVEAAHGFPTLDTGVACNEMGGDYLNACNFDAAGRLLAHLYGELSPRAETAPVDNLQIVDFSRFFAADADIADQGFVYTPASCRDDSSDCRLHVVFHGCRQGAEFIEDRFAVQAGYNEWAESNDIVVAYPQVEKSLLANPQGCWDWWGYTDADYDTRVGVQIAGVSAMIDAFVSGQLFGNEAGMNQGRE